MISVHFQIVDDFNFEVVDSYQRKVFTYHYEPAYQLAIQTWYGFIHPDTIIEIYKYIAKFAYEHKQPIYGSITDLIGIEGSFDSTNDWVVNEYMPRAVKYGFRLAGIIQPQEFYAQLALEDMEEIKRGYQTKIFDNFDECYSWITKELGKPSSKIS